MSNQYLQSVTVCLKIGSLLLAISGCALDGTSSEATFDERTESITDGVADGSMHREVVLLPTLGCSGVVISARYILTAGHCVDSAIGFPQTSNGTISSLKVVFSGDGTTKTTVYSGRAKAVVPELYLQEFVDPCGFPEHDIALIKLDADMSSFVRARLQQLNFSMPSRQEIVGWGNHDGFIPFGTLRESGVTKLSSWGGDGFIKVDQDPASGDHGDSGGGMFVKPSSSSSQRVLTGLVVCGDSSHTAGSLIASHTGFIFDQASAWGRPLSCTPGSLGSVQFLGSCTD